MGLMDSLLGAAAQLATDKLAPAGAQADGMAGGGLDAASVIGALLTQGGGISGLVEKFQTQGMGDAASSWVGTGANLPVSADQVTQALGPDLLGSVLGQLGGGAGASDGGTPALAQIVAQVLPAVIDQLTPHGQVPADNGLGGLGNLGALAGLAGQLLGGARA